MIRLVMILLAAALGPVLAQAKPGLWELRRVPDDGKPVQRCIADIGALAQVEQRRETCGRKLVSSDGASSVLRYTCQGGNFGQSTLTVVTPRSLTIETQGISGGLPFNYVVHARRLGDCEAR
jgi:hypothetical protein